MCCIISKRDESALICYLKIRFWSFFSRKWMGRLFNTYTDAIPVAFPSNTPLIIGYDNINIYKGKARFSRLKRKILPVMWNLTVCMAWKPNIEGIEHLWESPDTACKPQKDILALTVEDIFLGI